MTIDQFIARQRKKIEAVKQKALRIAAYDTHRKMANRIFVDGEASNESLIGSYNTTNPLYVNPRNSPKSFPTGGKTGNSKLSNTEKTPTGRRKKVKHKTAFFYSYRDFKRTIGQPTDRVRLNLFGRMQSDFISGFRKVSTTEYVVSFKEPINLKKARGQERRFGKVIFRISAAERKAFNDTMRLEIKRILYAK